MSLEKRAAEAAGNAVCTRCGALMIPDSRIPRLTTGTYRRVQQGGVEHFNLCCDCSPEFRLFMTGVGL